MKERLFSNLLFMGLVFFLSSNSVYASPYGCSGKVKHLGVDSGGDIVVELEGVTPVHKICNVNSKGSYTFETSSCKLVYSALLSAKVSEREISISYNNNQSCSTLPTWGYVFDAYYIQGPS